LDRSPSTSHRSAAVWIPTRITTNRPTNLTLTAEAIITPVNTSHPHQWKENALLRQTKMSYIIHMVDGFLSSAFIFTANPSEVSKL